MSCCKELTKKQQVFLKICSADQFKVEADIAIESMKLQGDAAKLVENEDWTGLIKLTGSMRGKALNAISRLKGLAKVSEQMLAVSCQTDTENEQFVTNLTEKLQNAKTSSEVEKALMDLGKSQSFLNDFLELAKKERKPVSVIQEHLLIDSLSTRLKYAIAIGYTGYWGGFFAAYNLNMKSYIPKRFRRSEVRQIAKQVAQLQALNEDTLTELYAVLVNGSQQDIHDKGLNILHKQEESLEWIARLVAVVSASTQAALKGKYNKMALDLGEVDLALGQAVRTWMLLTTASLYYARIGVLAETHKDVNAERKNAKKLAFDSKISNGKDVTISSLAQKGQDYHDKLVEVKGFVRNLHAIRTRDGKLLTLFTIYKPGRKETIEAAAIFEHLGHRGLINSAYVNVVGTWKQTSNISDNPTLQIERIQLSELKKQSWMDYVATAVRPWFDFYPNSHHVSWSIRPEHKGKNGMKSALTGAGEILFIRPFGAAEKGE